MALRALGAPNRREYEGLSSLPCSLPSAAILLLTVCEHSSPLPRLLIIFPSSALQDQEIAELKEEALRWAANDTRLRQINQQLHNENRQLRAAGPATGSGGGGGGGGNRGWDSHSRGPSPNAS